MATPTVPTTAQVQSPGPDAHPNAAASLYDCECALHAARQSRVDAWIAAASDKLHQAVAEYLASQDRPQEQR